jgi:hypothetical protein
MAVRDNARSDLYLAQLKMQSAPNTPGLPGGILSPRDGGWRPPQGFDVYNTERDMEMGEAGLTDQNTQYAVVNKVVAAKPKPFALQAPPKKHGKTSSVSSASLDGLQAPASPAIINDHMPAAEGEVQYGAVAIPGAYAAPASPGFVPQPTQSAGFDFGIDSRINKK